MEKCSPNSFREGRRWRTQKEERCLAVPSSREGAAVGRSQSLLRALAVVRVSQSQHLPRALG